MPRDPIVSPTGPYVISLKIDEVSVNLVDALAAQMGVTRAAFVRAACQQAVHRYLVGVYDPIRPVPVYVSRAKIRKTADPDKFRAMMEDYLVDGDALMARIVATLDTVQPVSDTLVWKSLRRRAPSYDANNPASYSRHLKKAE